MRGTRTTLTALFALLAAPLVAGAQWSPSATLDLGMGYGRMALSQAALDNARKLSQDSDEAFRSPAAKAGPQARFDPSFTPVEAVSHTVAQRFARYYGGDDPADREVMLAKVRSGEYHEHFRSLMSEHGLGSINDLVEVSTARYVVLWEIIHGRKVTSAQARAVRDQLRAQFARDRWISGLDDAGKQELAETFVLHVAAAEQANAELLRRNDPGQLARYRAGVQEQLLPGGPRLDRLAISDEGFVRR